MSDEESEQDVNGFRSILRKKRKEEKKDRLRKVNTNEAFLMIIFSLYVDELLNFCTAWGRWRRRARDFMFTGFRGILKAASYRIWWGRNSRWNSFWNNSFNRHFFFLCLDFSFYKTSSSGNLLKANNYEEYHSTFLFFSFLFLLFLCCFWFAIYIFHNPLIHGKATYV